MGMLICAGCSEEMVMLQEVIDKANAKRLSEILTSAYHKYVTTHSSVADEPLVVEA